MEGKAVGGAEVGVSVRWEEGALVSDWDGARLDGLLVVGLTLASFPIEGRVVGGGEVRVGASLVNSCVSWEEGTLDSNWDGARLLWPDNAGVAEGEWDVDVGSKDGASRKAEGRKVGGNVIVVDVGWEAEIVELIEGGELSVRCGRHEVGVIEGMAVVQGRPLVDKCRGWWTLPLARFPVAVAYQ